MTVTTSMAVEENGRLQTPKLPQISKEKPEKIFHHWT
jgi:hypothetical protein